MRFCGGLFVAGALTAGGALSASAAEREIVLQDHIRKAWRRELVSFPVTFPRGACHARSLALRGPRGPVACQLSSVQAWPGTDFVKGAKLSFVVDLAALAREAYVLSFGKRPIKRKAAQTDLKVSPGKGTVELSTSRFGVRLLLGEKKYAPPAPASAAPSPVADMSLPDGTKFGSSRLYGKRPVASYSARVVADGPVFAAVKIRYTYADGSTLDLVAQLAAGDSQVLWRMNSSADVRDGGGELLLSTGLGPLILHAVPWEWHKNTWGAEKFKTIDVVPGKWPAGALTNLVPWGDWWDDQTQTSWTLKTPKKGNVLRIASSDPGVWVEPDPPGTLGYWSKWQPKMIPLVREQDGTILMRISAASGRRTWTVGGPGEPLGRRLNVVKDYVLEWPDAARFRHPRLFTTQKELEAFRTRRPADPKEVARLLRRADEIRTYPSYKDSPALAAYLMTGSPDVARKGQVVERLRRHLARLGKFDLMRGTFILTNLYDGLIDSALVSPEERRVMRAQMAYLGYPLVQPEHEHELRPEPGHGRLPRPGPPGGVQVGAAGHQRGPKVAAGGNGAGRRMAREHALLTREHGQPGRLRRRGPQRRLPRLLCRGPAQESHALPGQALFAA
jgi:hypothetical protein